MSDCLRGGLGDDWILVQGKDYYYEPSPVDLVTSYLHVRGNVGGSRALVPELDKVRGRQTSLALIDDLATSRLLISRFNIEARSRYHKTVPRSDR